MTCLGLKELPRYECLRAAAKQYPDLDLSACEVILNLLRVGDELMERKQEYWQSHHISPGRFGVMMLLWGATGGGEGATLRTPAELAAASGVTRATITGLVDTLERDGLVRRERKPTDRRMMSVVLTAKGEAFLRAALPGHFRLMSEVTRGLTGAERKTLVHLLQKILLRATAARLVPGLPVAANPRTGVNSRSSIS